MKTLFVTLLLALLAAPAIAENPAEAEIEFLLRTIGESGCIFERNGDRHSAGKAEEHLRMKYRRGKRHAKTAELFIERLASKSSISKKPYTIECPGQEPVPSGEWLKAALAGFRDAADNEPQ